MKNIKIKTDTKGATVLTSVIIIAATMVLISVSMGLNSINENQITLHQSQISELNITANGCSEEALYRLSRDSTYSGETLTIESSTCEITVSGNGNNRTIVIEAQKNNYNKYLELEVSINPNFSVSNWSELPS
ncbi:hypothetical protein GF354_02805 [Candidatus Peregrinibacteria bacterium]|nr:hypothetical protein [Candidatus Peregrinibacteria bacterium]